MLICGIKVSHDGGVALIDGTKLVFSIETEKLNNNYRYSHLGYMERVAEILQAEDVDIADVDSFVIDGWWAEDNGPSPCVRSIARGRPVTLQVAPYADAGDMRSSLRRYCFPTRDFGSSEMSYSSYHHVTGHLLSCYCSSPFAKHSEDALILVWDGGMVPRLYEVTAKDLGARLVAPLMPVVGNMFSGFSGRFDPFYADTAEWDEERTLRYELAIAGKAMAYSALGHVEEELFEYLDGLFRGMTQISTENASLIAQQVSTDRKKIFAHLSNADIIATMQAYLGRSLLKALGRTVRRYFAGRTPNFGIAGGCALNIKWNKLIRDSGLFQEVWIPPFPNDSGAAIGAAAAEMFVSGHQAVLDWDVYSGPRLRTGDAPDGWSAHACNEGQLARLLHEKGEPVVVLSARAELGPRALGNRSILAPATDRRMKGLLNELKGREWYRPIAPICLESKASDVFDPGVRDPYMLFEHRVRPEWAEIIPAVVHLDGTARLQTIEVGSDAAGRILAAYERLSGVPVLCNTSANFSGHGFFPDVASAIRWGKTNYVWSDGQLYVSPDVIAESLPPTPGVG